MLTILEKQEIEVDPWMLEVRREAWDCGNRCSTSAARRSQQSRGTDQRQAFEDPRDAGSITAVVGRGVFLEHYCDNRTGGSTATAGTWAQGPDP